MAGHAGAAFAHINRQYIYINGLVDPRDPSGTHALTAGNEYSMWVNAQGRRFTNETGFDKKILVDLLHQKPASYWAIFDETTRDKFGVRGAAWLKNPVQGNPVLDNPEAAKKARSIEELAAMAGLPADALMQSVKRFNAMVEAGEDTDFHRFGPGDHGQHKIEQAPFYAVQMFPMTRKSMGGIAVDHQARALNPQGQVITGLYAVGELNGSVGINGKHGMDGMFLGPAIITGRLAGRSIAAAYGKNPESPGVAAQPVPASEPRAEAGPWQATLTAGNLESMLASPRKGYWHFEVSHRLVLERRYACTRCHSARLPFAPVNDREGKLTQARICTNCH